MADATKVWTEIRPNGLTPQLNEQLLSMRDKRKFVAKEWVVQKAGMLNHYMSQAGLKACTISVSGGVDSAVMYGLCTIASKMPGSPIQRVVGVAQPIHSTASIWRRALELPAAFGGEVVTVDVQRSEIDDNDVASLPRPQSICVQDSESLSEFKKVICSVPAGCARACTHSIPADSGRL